jgi:hypothetical protein
MDSSFHCDTRIQVDAFSFLFLLLVQVCFYSFFDYNRCKVWYQLTDVHKRLKLPHARGLHPRVSRFAFPIPS